MHFFFTPTHSNDLFQPCSLSLDSSAKSTCNTELLVPRTRSASSPPARRAAPYTLSPRQKPEPRLPPRFRSRPINPSLRPVLVAAADWDRILPQQPSQAGRAAPASVVCARAPRSAAPTPPPPRVRVRTGDWETLPGHSARATLRRARPSPPAQQARLPLTGRIPAEVGQLAGTGPPSSRPPNHDPAAARGSRPLPSRLPGGGGGAVTAPRGKGAAARLTLILSTPASSLSCSTSRCRAFTLAPEDMAAALGSEGGGAGLREPRGPEREHRPGAGKPLRPPRRPLPRLSQWPSPARPELQVSDSVGSRVA